MSVTTVSKDKSVECSVIIHEQALNLVFIQMLMMVEGDTKDGLLTASVLAHGTLNNGVTTKDKVKAVLQDKLFNCKQSDIKGLQLALELFNMI